MPALRQLDRVETRVLGALRCIDAATGVPVMAKLAVEPPPRTRVIRNRSGLYVISRHEALATHEAAFAAPPIAPPAGSIPLVFTLRDPAGTYLARTVEIRLPRDPDPAHGASADSLFNPVDVELYRSASAPLGANWVGVRVSATERDTGDALGNVVMRVRSNGRVLARGLSDWRGEACVPVVGVPITTWSEDAEHVVATEIDATLEIFFDSTAGGFRTRAADVAAGRAPANPPVCNPAAAEANPAAARQQAALRLVTGRTLPVSINLDLPG